MAKILNVSDPLQVNTLFLQPTRWCDLNCKGCYVKEHEVFDGTTREQEQHTPMIEQFKLIDYYHHEYLANQITVSIDDFPPDLGMAEPAGRLMLGLNYSRHNMRTHMLDLYMRLIKMRRDRCQENLDKNRDRFHNMPELHFTYHSLQTLCKYQNALGIDLVGPLSNLNVVSFSHLTENDIGMLSHIANEVHVNYNHLIPSNVTSFNIDKYVERMTRIGEIVDSIYLVIFKRPVGRDQKHVVGIGDRARMQGDISYIQTMLGRLPEHVRSKTHIDGCLQDTVQFQRTGFGCSSNVSRIQVWPDGSVSGCPYAFAGNTAPAYSFQDLLDNITEARREYDWTRCHLPDVYNSLHKRPKVGRARV